MDKTHLDPAYPARRPPDALHDLRSLGEYRLLRRLGEGGMGAVYLGWKEGEETQVAVKILNDQLAGSQSYIDRFYREASSGKRLHHPNIVRTPRDRYQTASELIVDLERSRLSVTLPSFADPELAEKDPWVQECLASSAEPTRLDPERPPKPERAVGNGDDVWLLRFRNRAGRVCRTRATTDQIIQRLHEGRLPRVILARRPSQPRLRPLASFAEFKGLTSDKPRKKRLPRSDTKSDLSSPVLATSPNPTTRGRLVLLTVAGAAALVAAATAVWTLLLCHS